MPDRRKDVLVDFDRNPLQQTASDMNVLACFLGRRDIGELSPAALEQACGIHSADAMVLFGGSILEGAETLALAMRAGIARTSIIVGGAGHTTGALRDQVRKLCPELAISDSMPEAEIFQAYLASRHHMAADLLETESTNCGNNIVYLRRLLEDHGALRGTLILSQDAAMQLRMAATAAKEMPEVRIVNYASHAVRMEVRGGSLAYDHEPLGMWDPGRYLELLMGEIPRLRDEEDGYGPRGRGFLAHVDIPSEVDAAWKRLRRLYPSLVRSANPKYAG